MVVMVTFVAMDILSYLMYILLPTHEGDTTVLLLQVASFLMKTVSQLVSENQLDGTTT